MSDPIQLIDQAIEKIKADTYTLTDDDIYAISIRLESIKTLIKDIYEKRGKIIK